MHRSLPVALVLLLVFVLPAAAQTPSPQVETVSLLPANAGWLLDKGDSEFMATAGAAYGVVVFHSAGGHRFVLQTTSWARVLSEPHLIGPLRGRFAWAVEAVPLFGQYEPTKTYGFGVSPLVWRWNFVGRGKVMPYAELAGGGLWTTEPVPDRTTTGNFTAHAGGGVRFFLSPSRAFVVNYWFHHISNGNRLERNPGVNSHIVQVGLSYVPPRHRE